MGTVNRSYGTRTGETADADLSPPIAQARPYLLLLGSASAGGQPPAQRLHAIDGGLELGRSRSRGGRTLTLADQSVSAKHARISQTGQGFEIIDLDSRNGTFVDGVAVKQQPLRDGALLFLGGHAAVFRLLTDDALSAIDADLRTPLGPVSTASPAMAAAMRKLRRLAPTSDPIFLTGETGTGKEVYSRATHRASGRRGKFVAINCAAIPVELVESELFGYVRGAHSQATQSKRGLIEQADGGTLFLDELGDMPRPAQAKLLRFLQDREVLALGSTEARKVDTRVIAATSDLDGAQGAGLRKDLLMRLGTQPVLLPPLRERAEDLGVLIRHFMGAEVVPFDNAAFLALCLYAWPGNVRELEKVVREALLSREKETTIRLEHLPPSVSERLRRPAKASQVTRRPPTTAPGKEELESLLRQQSGRVSDVARRLGCQSSVVWRWIKRHQLDAANFRKPP